MEVKFQENGFVQNIFVMPNEMYHEDGSINTLLPKRISID
jgi:hypothetical protein